jgi:hypothetical protein
MLLRDTLAARISIRLIVRGLAPERPDVKVAPAQFVILLLPLVYVSSGAPISSVLL